MKIRYLVPPLYNSYFPALIWNSDVQESKATCHSCIQAPQKYETNLKCCTFWPFIPNYIVGQILQSKEVKYKAVQTVIRNHISKQLYTLPMGLMAPREYQIDFKKNKAQVFGKDESFLCPYFSKETNNCGAWIFRGSVCTSFYCESSYAKKGLSFWKHFENYMSYLEMGISQEVMAYKDYSPRDVNEQLDYLNADSEKKLTKASYKKIWKHFYGKEIEFYIQASLFADQLPKNQIKEVIGVTGIEIRKQMATSLEKIST